MRALPFLLISCLISCHICFASVGDIFMTVQDPAYYEKLVDQLEQDHSFESMDVFQKAVAEIFPKENVEGYHRLGLALYSRGHEEEADYVLRTFVEPHKTLTPGQGLEKAQDLLKKYQKMKSETGLTPAPGPDAEPSIETAKPARALPQPVTKPAAKKKEQPATDVIYLKNGQKMSGSIREKDEKGVWFEVGEGTQVYFSNSEIKEIKPAPKS